MPSSPSVQVSHTLQHAYLWVGTFALPLASCPGDVRTLAFRRSKGAAGHVCIVAAHFGNMPDSSRYLGVTVSRAGNRLKGGGYRLGDAGPFWLPEDRHTGGGTCDQASTYSDMTSSHTATLWWADGAICRQARFPLLPSVPANCRRRAMACRLSLLRGMHLPAR